MTQRIDLIELNMQRNRQAKASAQERVSWPVNLAPPRLSYDSHGHLLIVGGESHVRLAAERLLDTAPSLASLTLVVNARSDPDDIDVVVARALEATAALPCFTARRLSLTGYLGAFGAWLDTDEGPLDLAKAAQRREHFDLVLDLGDPALLPLDLPPPGYFHAAWGSRAGEAALAALPGLVGEFDKPQYVQIDGALCAHAGRGKSGCTRCLAVCPADAITSVKRRIEAWIEIDPYRCHGAGSCTSVCPTGAIQYRLPEANHQQDYVARLLESYRHAGGHQPVVRFVEAALLDGEATPADGHVLDVPLEELGAAGLDHWMSALADGAAEVRVQSSGMLPMSVEALIEDQLEQAGRLLEALGHDPRRLTVIEPGDVDGRDTLPCREALPPRERPAASGAATGGKRERLNASLAWLAAVGQPSGVRHELPAGAAFGGVAVDAQACTLCLGCVSVCPTPALAAGEDHPLLSFREADCVQCGLCEQACPEDAIALVPGFLAAPAREQRRVCKEEDAFACIRCGKPFASASAIAGIKAKLVDHPYFAGDAMSRLEMCQDCRVKDVWQELARDPEAQLKL